MWKNYPENRELIFGYASVLGTVITFVYTAYSAYQTSLSFDFAATVVALCILNFFLIISSLSIFRRYFYLQQSYNPLIKENFKLKSGLKTAAKICHNINHQSRILINLLYSDIFRNDTSKARERELSFEQYLIFLMDNIKEMFDVLTSDQCSVSLKIIVPDENSDVTYIRTHYRDSISYRERGRVDNHLDTYPSYENTAFKVILDPAYPNTFYYCNDLKAEKSYVNLNPNWQEHYNACLVLPISAPLNSSPTSSVVIGFICVDNYKGNFDKSITRNFLASIADLNFIVYNAFDSYKKFIGSSKSKEKTI